MFTIAYVLPSGLMGLNKIIERIQVNHNEWASFINPCLLWLQCRVVGFCKLSKNKPELLRYSVIAR